MTKLLIAVSQQSMFLAESKVAGCATCTALANVRFERLLDEVTGWNDEVSYVMPCPASCPVCGASLEEATLVKIRRVSEGSF